MVIPEMIERALHTSNPFDELRSVVKQLFADGHDDKAVYNLFEETRAQLRTQGREAEEDMVMEVMDCLVGWCSPSQVLKPDVGRSGANGQASPVVPGKAPSKGE